MRLTKNMRQGLVVFVLGFALLAPTLNPLHLISDPAAGSAEARGGRTPVGVGSVGVGTAGHGVARRSTRRAVIATGAVIATLPVGCPVVQVNGAPLYYCGGIYYQSSGDSYAVVTVN